MLQLSAFEYNLIQENLFDLNQFMLSAPLFTTQEVAELLKVSEATVRSWIKNKELRAVKLEREFRIAKVDLQVFVESRSTTDAPTEFRHVPTKR